MQHDLKMIETRQPEARMAAWCICGGWRYTSPRLHLEPIVTGFIEHLEEVQREEAVRRHNDLNDSFFST